MLKATITISDVYNGEEHSWRQNNMSW